ncbi:hypothetical protein MPTK1_1g14200 [Marchantia polymorpha subsp. ruderalis]|uniref:Reticulon-like protein n=2 Tax=Marchantia polymorpha TaxID=3197 RepID=A0AAF6AQ09_MARPO|nr:hypothetical protein MARPO_0179s0001 [Marchantia polymorpha]BBM98529.1 hypothetical protein Mp_1g14200 [Marchantia polymorpha subsp. ruderalis]|eukprot:PTQ27909.1 hypothetical protein MARPO_0179s0001 [Marchantia polymorpha]
MGSGREGSPAPSGGFGGVPAEKSSSRLALRGTRWAEPEVEDTPGSLRSSSGKEVVKWGTVAGRVEALSSPQRRSHRAAADGSPGAESGGNAGVKTSRKGPTRSYSAGSSHISAMEMEGVGVAPDAKFGRQETCGAGTGISLKSVSFRGGIADLTDRDMADTRGKSPRPTRIVELSELQDQSTGFARSSRSKLVKSPTRRLKIGSQEPLLDQALDQALEPTSRSQSRIRDTRVTRNRTDNSKHTRTEEEDLQDNVLDQRVTMEKSSRTRVSKSIRQISRADGQDVSSEIREPPSGTLKMLGSEAELQEENQAKTIGRRPKTTRRHTKRKPDEATDPYSEEAPELGLAENPPPARVREMRQSSSRAPKVLASTSSNSTSISWMQLFGDVIMWKDIPRSTLYFGAGCFGILSTSYVKNPSFGALTFTSYLALLYLAGIYCHRSFLGGGQVGNGVNWELSDTEALDFVRVVLPALNLVICKCGQLFCGDPFTTLKVAAMLWVLAQLGYWISLWSFARLAFILLVAVRAYFSQFPEVRLPKYPHNDNSGNSEQDELPPIIAPVEERALHTQPVLKEVKLETF